MSKKLTEKTTKKPMYETSDIVQGLMSINRVCDMVGSPIEGRKLIIPCNSNPPPVQMILGFEIIFELVE